MLEEFKFAMCHHKTKKTTQNVQNFDLKYELKITEPKRYENIFEDNSDYSYLPPIEQYKRHITKVDQMRQLGLDKNLRCNIIHKKYQKE